MSTEIIAQWRSKIQSGSEELVQNPIMSVYLENLELVASESVARMFDHHQTIASCRIRVPDYWRWRSQRWTNSYLPEQDVV